MNDNPSPFGIHPDDPLEARLTAWVLGEASPFEIAELESLVAKSPELQLFLARTRALHTLLVEAETSSNSSSEDWKLPSEKRIKLNTIFGANEVATTPVSSFQKESLIHRASFRAAIGIAACLIVTFIISRLYLFPKISPENVSEMIVTYMASEDSAVVQAEEGPAVLLLQENEGFSDGFAQPKSKLINEEIDAGLPEEKMEIADNRREPDSMPQAPFSSIAKKIASNTSSPVQIPVPDLALVEPSKDFGDGDNFGRGFGVGWGDGTPPESADASSLVGGKLVHADADPFADNTSGGELAARTRRSVDSAISRDSIDGILNRQERPVARPQAEAFAPAEPQPIDLADLSQEISANQEPFSTFSLNISDASFQLALAAVEKGERPDPESIKPEQFYNAVDYGDSTPSSLEPVAAAIDQTAHPVIPGRNLVRVAIRTASTGRSAAQPLRLTLLVDQSGSMVRADRRTAMDKALGQLATLLTENDRITVIGFSRTPRLIADSLPGNEAAKISDLINTTASEGGTNLEQAFNLSSELALRHKLDGAQNRIVLFTDGAANLGDADPKRLAGRVKELRRQGLAFDIAGIGTDDTNDRLLSELARHGNGRYYLVGENTGDSFAAQLAGAFRPAAENVKVQVKLNPERVGNYKLIGFEKDRLKTEDFHDDSVDAAELAADEAGVAIYQVETLPEGTGEIGEVSVRFRDTASGEMVERAWTIPHDSSTPAFDKAAPKTQLATLALLAAQKLQGGPLADAIRFGDFADTTARLKQAYANDAKAQRLLTLINALR